MRSSLRWLIRKEKEWYSKIYLLRERLQHFVLDIAKENSREKMK